MYQKQPITHKVYPNLETAIFNRGIKKKAIAKELNISQKAFINKMTGKSSFKWDEVCIMQGRFFPDIPPEVLLKNSQSV